MRRFWDDTAVLPLPNGYAVVLDGKRLRLPSGGELLAPSAALAAAVAAEWAAAGGGAKGGTLRPQDVPLTGLLGTAVERIAPDPAATVAALARYGETDLLCYHAEQPELAAQQAAEWQALLDWALLRFDAPLRVTTGLMPLPQAEPALRALRAALAGFTPLELAALGVAVPALGSLVLGLALAHARVDADEAHRLATLDDAFQARQWGIDAEAQARLERQAADIALAARLLQLARA